MIVLLVDDDSEALEQSAGMFRTAGFEVRRARDLTEARAALDEEAIRLVLAARRIGEASGLELLEAVQGRTDAPPVILVAGSASVEDAVETMRAGAADYLPRPLEASALERAVRRALAPDEPPGRFPRPTEERWDDPVPELIGVSTCIRNVKELIRAAARTESPAFIHGPTGTGKDLVARAIHRLSPRARGPFVALNCGALPEGLAESELFGAVKGAFTGAASAREGLIRAADGGTLFLDELGEMPLDLQVKLLRVLQEKSVRAVGATREEPVDVRILAATNRDPEESVRAGRLRQDLYYRLVVLRICIDPLGARPEDLPPLVEHYLGRLRERYGHGPTGITHLAMQALQEYPWPGNVRELENVLDLVFALGRTEGEIELTDLPMALRDPQRWAPAQLPPGTGGPTSNEPRQELVMASPAGPLVGSRYQPGAMPLALPYQRLGADGLSSEDRGGAGRAGEDVIENLPALRAPSPEAQEAPFPTLRDAEILLIQHALQRAQGNKSEAARLLGISRQRLYRRLEALRDEIFVPGE